MLKRITLLLMSLLMLFTPVNAFAETRELVSSNRVEAVSLKSFTLNRTSLTINKRDTYQLTGKFNPTSAKADIKYTTTDAKIAHISTKGVITGISPGKATITATTKVNGKTYTAKCQVTVKSPITKVSLDKKTATIPVGGNVGISVSYTPANTTDSKVAKWTSSNNKIAKVEGGRVYGLKPGTVTITCKMGTKTDTCKVTVKYVAPKYVDASKCYTILDKYRKKAGVWSLKRDARLESLAKIRAKELVTSYSHTRPNGKSGVDIIGNEWRGENIAFGYDTPEEVMLGWYTSVKGHRENMLSQRPIGKHFTKVGIAGYTYENVTYWVMLLSS